ncbi:MAG: hypothetical protein AAGH45_05945 [Pseudomonadota bacterium]
MTDHALSPDRLAAACAAAEADPAIQTATKHADFVAALDAGADRHVIAVNRGTVRLGAAGDRAPDFSVAGAPEAWADFVAPATPTTNGVLAMALQGGSTKDGRVESRFAFDGDPRKLWANMHALTGILSHLQHKEG